MYVCELVVRESMAANMDYVGVVVCVFVVVCCECAMCESVCSFENTTNDDADNSCARVICVYVTLPSILDVFVG